MTKVLNDHVSEEVLERYAMGHTSNDETAMLEEHLLICNTCQYKLQSLDEYLAVTKEAARALARRPVRRSYQHSRELEYTPA
jgi:anti-sigma factor RsiW